jgi:hypothetical protein
VFQVFQRANQAPQKFHTGDRVVCQLGQGKGIVVGDIFWEGYQRFLVIFDGKDTAEECVSEYLNHV